MTLIQAVHGGDLLGCHYLGGTTTLDVNFASTGFSGFFYPSADCVPFVTLLFEEQPSLFLVTFELLFVLLRDSGGTLSDLLNCTRTIFETLNLHKMFTMKSTIDYM